MNYDFKLEFLSSKQIAHADGLSRLIPTQTELEDSVIAALRIDSEIETMINNTIRELQVTLLEIKIEAVNDKFIKTTKQKLSRGDVTSDIYSVCDDVLLYIERVTILKTLQKRILKDFHMGHPGTNRMKSLMRSFVYWPSIDQDITSMVKTCKGCALVAKAPPSTHKLWPKSEQP